MSLPTEEETPSGVLLTPTEDDIKKARQMCGIGGIVILADLDERYMMRNTGIKEILMWSTGGHRITFSGSFGTLMVSRSKDVDLHYPGKGA